MTAVLDPDSPTPAEHPTPDARRASWPARAGAFAVDLAPGFGVVTTMTLLALAAPPSGWLWWVYTGVGAATLVGMVLNRLVLPRLIGWTLGRALFGIAVRHRKASGGQADTDVHRVSPPARALRRLVAPVLISTTVLCTAAVGLSYVLVYQPERAVGAARAQIAEQGPRIVEQIMSYDAKTLSDDFTRAQTLATAGYLPQLLAQQQAVQDGLQNGDARTNEYRAVTGAVLPNPAVTPDQASMLLAMQGQRGTIVEDLKFIAATVRVDFDKSLDGQWRVANLTVLKTPRLNRAGQ